MTAMSSRRAGRTRAVWAQVAPVPTRQDLDQSPAQRLERGHFKHRWHVPPVDLLDGQQIADIDIDMLGDRHAWRP